jgi:GT2 family glycosyltransferase
MEPPGQLQAETSIIICTLDRPADLARCLESLQPFRPAVAEILIVNNGPRLAPVAEIARRFGARVVTEARRGVSRARNAGIRAATGSIIAFLDDDTLADANWIPLLVAPFRDPQVLAVVGSVWPQTIDNPVSQAFDRMHRALLPESQLTSQAPREENPFPLREALVGNANMAFRREAFERFGQFDARFGRGARIGSSEEADLLLRILRGGAKLVVEPAAGIYHRHPTARGALRKWAFQSGCGHTAILTKYFLKEPSLRGAILRYTGGRVLRQRTGKPGSVPFRVPRMPLLLGSLYGPVAFLFSGKG